MTISSDGHRVDQFGFSAGEARRVFEAQERGLVSAEQPYLIPCADCGGRGPHTRRLSAPGAHPYRFASVSITPDGMLYTSQEHMDVASREAARRDGPPTCEGSVSPETLREQRTIHPNSAGYSVGDAPNQSERRFKASRHAKR